MGEYALPCIVCHADLKNFSPETDNQPLKGTEFTGGGDYGSAVTDVSGEKFFVNVCDDCILKALDEGRAGKIRR